MADDYTPTYDDSQSTYSPSDLGPAPSANDISNLTSGAADSVGNSSNSAPIDPYSSPTGGYLSDSQLNAGSDTPSKESAGASAAGKVTTGALQALLKHLGAGSNASNYATLLASLLGTAGTYSTNKKYSPTFAPPPMFGGLGASAGAGGGPPGGYGYQNYQGANAGQGYAPRSQSTPNIPNYYTYGASPQQNFFPPKMASGGSVSRFDAGGQCSAPPGGTVSPGGISIGGMWNGISPIGPPLGSMSGGIGGNPPQGMPGNGNLPPMQPLPAPGFLSPGTAGGGLTPPSNLFGGGIPGASQGPTMPPGPGAQSPGGGLSPIQTLPAIMPPQSPQSPQSPFGFLSPGTAGGNTGPMQTAFPNTSPSQPGLVPPGMPTTPNPPSNIYGGLAGMNVGGTFGAMTGGTFNAPPPMPSPASNAGGMTGKMTPFMQSTPPQRSMASGPNFNQSRMTGGRRGFGRQAFGAQGMAHGGAAPSQGALAHASNASRHVNGPGDGTSDSIAARLADGEYVLSADVVGAIGNGSNNAGAKKLDALMHNIRKHKATGNGKLPPDTKPLHTYMGK